MHSKLLSAIFAANGKISDAAQAEYLQGLKPVLTNLSRGYRTQQVSINYSDPQVQACYLLRYFLLYKELLKDVLRRTAEVRNRECIAGDAQNIKAVFVGPGPCPEVAALFEFLNSGKTPRNLTAYLCDRYLNHWMFSREIVESTFLSASNGSQCKIIGHQVNLADPRFMIDVISHVREADFFILQNCLNETGYMNIDTVRDNLLKALRELKPGRLFIIIDRAKYELVEALIKQIEAAATSQGLGQILLSMDEDSLSYDGVEIRNAMPEMLRISLFDDADGRMATRYVPYIALVIKAQ